MKRALLAPLLLVLVAELSGCAGALSCGLQDYKPLVLKTSAPLKVVLEAAYEAARETGATHVDLEEAELRVSAIFDEQDKTRERLRVQVTEWGQVSIDVRTEMLDKDSDWIAPDRVCRDYSHARERGIADTILAKVKLAVL